MKTFQAIENKINLWLVKESNKNLKLSQIYNGIISKEIAIVIIAKESNIKHRN